MANNGKLHRLYLLMEKVENGYHPTFREIYDHYYNHGFEISQRSLQRDLKTLRLEFGIEVAYHPGRNGYYLDRSRSINVESFYRFLEYAQSADLLSQTIRDNRSNLDYIHFESQTKGSLRGWEHLRALMFAVRNNRIIRFVHYNFMKDTYKSYRLYPYGLKEYQNRWYVVGQLPGIDNPLKFGIDRIESLQIEEQTFERDPAFDIQDLFDDVVGLSHTESKKERVVLHFTPLQGKYVKTLPLHASQKILHEDDQGVKVQIRVKPNFELIQKLMTHCDMVTVLQPQWLVERMKSIYQAALDNYGGS